MNMSMEERFRYDCRDKWFKGNVHMHTSRSDGRLNLAEAARYYTERGYDFISITDHRVPFVGAQLDEQLPIMILDGIELDGTDDQGSGYHVVCIGGVDGISKDRHTFSISQKKLDNLLWDLEIDLLESDVALPVVEEIKGNIKEHLRSVRGGSGKQFVHQALKDAISNVLASSTMNFQDFLETTEKPVVIMFVGVNGSGKTLTIGKIATLLRKHGLSSVMAAGDTFRAGAIE